MIEPVQPPLLDGFVDDAPELVRRPRRAHPPTGGALPRGEDHSALSTQHSALAKKHPKNRLNELAGDEWIFFTKSLITTAYPSGYGHELRRAHGANKPPQLMQALIEFFTAAGERVLDPFAGVGGTLIGAAIARPPRECVGIEISPKWVEIYRRVVGHSRGELTEYPLFEGDSLTLLADESRFPSESFHFVCTDPPYNVHLEQTMANDPRYLDGHANRRTPYNMRSDKGADLANLASYDAYLEAMQHVLRHCYRVLVPGRYLAVILRNAYQGGRYVFTHVDVARRAEAEGFVTKGEKIWYQAGTRLRPYGYPYAYIPNITHQHIVILQKPRSPSYAQR